MTDKEFKTGILVVISWGCFLWMGYYLGKIVEYLKWDKKNKITKEE